jgi:hypothetical protein
MWWDGSLTATGAKELAVVPLPSCPLALDPQARTCPPEVSASP